MPPLLITRICAGMVSTGITGFGLITFLPNIMLSDSGTPEAIITSKIGILATTLYVGTGLFGIGSSIFAPIYIKYIPSNFALSTLVQVSAFVFYPLVSEIKNYFNKKSD